MVEPGTSTTGTFICHLILLVPLHCRPPCPRRPSSHHLLRRAKYSTPSSLTCSKAKSYSSLEFSTFPVKRSRPDEPRSKWNMLHHHRDPHAARSRCSHCRKRVSSCGLSPKSQLTCSAQGLEKSAAALSKSTGRRCIPAPADVRKPEQLEAAVSKARSELGRIDHVICGAAGNLYVASPSWTDKIAYRPLMASHRTASRQSSISISSGRIIRSKLHSHQFESQGEVTYIYQPRCIIGVHHGRHMSARPRLVWMP